MNRIIESGRLKKRDNSPPGLSMIFIMTEYHKYTKVPAPKKTVENSAMLVRNVKSFVLKLKYMIVGIASM